MNGFYRLVIYVGSTPAGIPEAAFEAGMDLSTYALLNIAYPIDMIEYHMDRSYAEAKQKILAYIQECLITLKTPPEDKTVEQMLSEIRSRVERSQTPDGDE